MITETNCIKPHRITARSAQDFYFKKGCHAVAITLEILSGTPSLKHVNICTIQFIFVDIIEHIVGVTSKDRIAGGWS